MGLVTFTMRVRMPLATVILVSAGIGGAAFLYYKMEEKKREQKMAAHTPTGA